MKSSTVQVYGTPPPPYIYIYIYIDYLLLTLRGQRTPASSLISAGLRSCRGTVRPAQERACSVIFQRIQRRDRS